MVSAGVVAATQDPRLASALATVPSVLNALFQITTVMLFPEVLIKVFVNGYPSAESTLIMLEPCGEPIFPIAAISEPDPMADLPNAVNLLARPSKSFHKVAAPEATSEMISEDLVLALGVELATEVTAAVEDAATATTGDAEEVATGTGATVDEC